MLLFSFGGVVVVWMCCFCLELFFLLLVFVFVVVFCLFGDIFGGGVVFIVFVGTDVVVVEVSVVGDSFVVVVVIVSVSFVFCWCFFC